MSSQEKEDKVVVLLSGDVINILENNAMPFTIQDYYKVLFYSLLHFYYLFYSVSYFILSPLFLPLHSILLDLHFKRSENKAQISFLL